MPRSMLRPRITADRAAAERGLGALAESAPAVLFALDAGGRITLARGAGLAAIGIAPEAIEGESALELVRHDPRVSGAIRRALTGEAVTVDCALAGRVFELRLGPIAQGGRRTGTAGVALDVTERRLSDARLARLSLEHQVTGLPTRSAFESAVARRLARARIEGGTAGIVTIDLDGFAEVNDSLGHATGDAVLREVGARLRAAAAPEELVAHLAGDGFVVYVPGGVAAAEGTAGRMLHALAEPLRPGALEFHVGASVGISLFPRHGEQLPELLRNAEAALRRAKRAGRGGQAVWEPGDNHVCERLAQTARLRHALTAGDLLLHYQPIFSADGRLSAFEALARWEDPERGMVAPGEFIPVAEASGLIAPLGAWVIDAALAQLAGWDALGLPTKVALNVSPVQLRRDDLVATMAAAIARHRVDPARIVVEITESVAMDDVVQTTSVLRELATLGVDLAIDDFGAGHSSLTRLRTLPVAALKVDRALLADVGADPGAEAVVAATLALAQALGIPTVAEGVETETQAEFLRALGCDFLQGFGLGRPMPAAEATALLQRAGVMAPA